MGFLGALPPPGAADEAAALLVTKRCLRVTHLALVLYCSVHGKIQTSEKIDGKQHIDSIQNFQGMLWSLIILMKSGKV